MQTNVPIYLKIIRKAAAIAKANFSAERQNYQILLILTDGVIDDLTETTREVVMASSLPLSIGKKIFLCS